MLEADLLGHRIGFLALRHAVLVEPDVLGRLALLEEQKVCADRGVGLEHGIGQADDDVEGPIRDGENRARQQDHTKRQVTAGELGADYVARTSLADEGKA